MIDFNIMGLYVVSVFILIATPGPIIALIVRNATLGFQYALFTIFGTHLASLVMIACAFGALFGIIKLSFSLLSWVSFVGCGVIFYLGSYGLFHHYKAKEQKPIKKTLKMHFIEGFSMAISNPKDILFFSAFFPQFFGIHSSLGWSVAILVGLWVILDFSLLLSYAFLAQRSIFMPFEQSITLLSNLVLIGLGGGGMIYFLLS